VWSCTSISPLAFKRCTEITLPACCSSLTLFVKVNRDLNYEGKFKTGSKK